MFICISPRSTLALHIATPSLGLADYAVKPSGIFTSAKAVLRPADIVTATEDTGRSLRRFVYCLSRCPQPMKIIMRSPCASRALTAPPYGYLAWLVVNYEHGINVFHPGASETIAAQFVAALGLRASMMIWRVHGRLRGVVSAVAQANPFTIPSLFHPQGVRRRHAGRVPRVRVLVVIIIQIETHNGVTNLNGNLTIDDLGRQCAVLPTAHFKYVITNMGVYLVPDPRTGLRCKAALVLRLAALVNSGHNGECEPPPAIWMEDRHVRSSRHYMLERFDEWNKTKVVGLSKKSRSDTIAKEAFEKFSLAGVIPYESFKVRLQSPQQPSAARRKPNGAQDIQKQREALERILELSDGLNGDLDDGDMDDDDPDNHTEEPAKRSSGVVRPRAALPTRFSDHEDLVKTHAGDNANVGQLHKATCELFDALPDAVRGEYYTRVAQSAQNAKSSPESCFENQPFGCSTVTNALKSLPGFDYNGLGHAVFYLICDSGTVGSGAENSSFTLWRNGAAMPFADLYLDYAEEILPENPSQFLTMRLKPFDDGWNKGQILSALTVFLQQLWSPSPHLIHTVNTVKAASEGSYIHESPKHSASSTLDGGDPSPVRSRPDSVDDPDATLAILTHREPKLSALPIPTSPLRLVVESPATSPTTPTSQPTESPINPASSTSTALPTSTDADGDTASASSMLASTNAPMSLLQDASPVASVREASTTFTDLSDSLAMSPSTGATVEITLNSHIGALGSESGSPALATSPTPVPPAAQATSPPIDQASTVLPITPPDDAYSASVTPAEHEPHTAAPTNVTGTEPVLPGPSDGNTSATPVPLLPSSDARQAPRPRKRKHATDAEERPASAAKRSSTRLLKTANGHPEVTLNKRVTRASASAAATKGTK
ncbi:uncharacterized protein BXZ73DRAFT_80407 [Epithele typhae]|uniref:uncharacterized protein n=1 Tax=Epithele typhae TaxID=378194 RepID=UPI0020085017|nr:uncharacterized protein BXZ73DRAFT_80407 [Epithele typhae]KAH9919197.1 hypothetical protein BXZ73DRAFT_80407 [Epithele typhae]